MTDLPPPDQTQLEDLAAQLLQRVFGCLEPPTRYGRSGQKQQGIDVVARLDDETLIGCQCKAYNRSKLARSMLDADLAAAHDFQPRLARLVFITSASRDVDNHNWALHATLHGQKKVQIWFWEDVCELLVQHNLAGSYLVRRLPANALIQAVTAAGLRVVNSVVPDDSPISPTDNSPEVLALQHLLADGRASVIVERLGGASDLDEPRAFILARAHVQRLEYTEARGVLCSLESVRAVALLSLVLARSGDHQASAALIATARARAKPDGLPYVVAMDLLRRLAVESVFLDWTALLAEVPPEVHKHPSVLGALAEVAANLRRYDDAIDYYQAADANDERPSALRRLALLTNRLARTLDALPSGEVETRDPIVRRELENVRAGLMVASGERLDHRLLAVVHHSLHLTALVLGDFDEALASIERAVDRDPADVALWRRWAIATLFSRSPLDLDRLRRAPTDPALDLMLCQLEADAGMTCPPFSGPSRCK